MQIGLVELATIAGAIMAIVACGKWIKSVIDRALKPIREMESTLKIHNDALRSTLRNNITLIHKETTASGKIGRYTLESALDMHKQYKLLGGNGFVDEVIGELKDLPIDTGGND